MTTQPEALRLADELKQTNRGYEPVTEAAAELRRLHELNEDLYQQSVGFIARIAALEKALGMAVEALEIYGAKSPDVDDTLAIAKQTLGGDA